jgi:hypothetical protein
LALFLGALSLKLEAHKLFTKVEQRPPRGLLQGNTEVTPTLATIAAPSLLFTTPLPKLPPAQPGGGGACKDSDGEALVHLSRSGWRWGGVDLAWDVRVVVGRQRLSGSGHGPSSATASVRAQRVATVEAQVAHFQADLVSARSNVW